MYSKQGEFVCMLKSMCVCACVRACTCMMYLQKLGGAEGLKASDKHMRKESRLVLHEIVYGGKGMYPSWHI